MIAADGILRNRRTAAWLALLAMVMVGLGFAAVPLYKLFCQVTGFAGTTQRVTEAEAAAVNVDSAHTVSVRFDSNVAPNLPWEFRPEQRTTQVTLGARDLAIFIARNNSDRPVTGTATFNVTPERVGRYFTKIQCFCFTQQTLQPGEQVRMPVIFFVDPAMANDPDAQNVQEITLSYTFFPVDEGQAPG